MFVIVLSYNTFSAQTSVAMTCVGEYTCAICLKKREKPRRDPVRLMGLNQ